MSKRVIAPLNIVIILVAIVFTSLNSSMVEDGTQWQWTYGGSEADYARAVIQTSDGGFAFAGTTQSFTKENERGFLFADFWLGKINAYGELQWYKTYDDKFYNEQGYSLIETNDVGFILVGNRYCPPVSCGGECLLRILKHW